MTKRDQMLHVAGPWKDGTKLFTRRCRGKHTESPVDETAAHMLERVEFDAAEYEVCAAAHLRALHACALLAILFARRDKMPRPFHPLRTRHRMPHRRASARCVRTASQASRRPIRRHRGKCRRVRSGHSVHHLPWREVCHEERASSTPLARCRHRACGRHRRAQTPAAWAERAAWVKSSTRHRWPREWRRHIHGRRRQGLAVQATFQWKSVWLWCRHRPVRMLGARGHRGYPA